MSDNYLTTWDDGDSKGREKAFANFANVHESYEGVTRAYHRDFLDIEPNRSVKPGFTSDDYYAFRVEEAIPRKAKRAIKMCMDAYDKVGIVRNIIDLMGDFGCQGINIVHENKSVEKFFQQWFKKVNGKERSERYLNNLYRTGNVFVYRSYANATPRVEQYLKSLAADIKVQVPTTKKREIPWRYNFLNPLAMEVKDGNINYFLGRKNYELTANSFFDNFKDGTIPIKVLETLPPEVKRAIKDKKQKIELDPEKLCVCYYKKDDWQQWAYPMVYAILDDIVMLEKMKLADLAALDGAISNIRLWTLGNFDYKVLPTKAGINKLRNILASNTGGGTMELVWGPELSFTESNSQVYKFLGSEKYQSVLNNIYAGLGVPPTLTGMASNGGGFTNNFISLKTLTERLQYGRDHLTAFWMKEVEQIRKAMGFRKPAHVVYDQMSLSDENAEKNLLIQLADRDIISNETLLDRFKEISPVERLRLQRESAARDKDKLPPKASPFHQPEQQFEMDKIDKQGEIQERIAIEKEKNKPKPEGPGRPAKKPDGGPRKKRVDTPKSTPGKATVAEIAAWAIHSYDYLECLSKPYLSTLGKTTKRSLSKAQAAELCEIKLRVFANLPLLDKVDDKKLHKVLSENKPVPKDLREKLNTAGVSVDSGTLEDYETGVIAVAVAHFLESCPSDSDEN